MKYLTKKQIITFFYSYVEWSLHEPFPGVYNFEGDANLEYFMKLIKDEGMYLILRPGPYICAERDFVSAGYVNCNVELFAKYEQI